MVSILAYPQYSLFFFRIYYHIMLNGGILLQDKVLLTNLKLNIKYQSLYIKSSLLHILYLKIANKELLKSYSLTVPNKNSERHGSICIRILKKTKTI